MKATQLFLGLIPTVAAIDIYLRSDKVCQGGYESCPNINPNTCCGKKRPVNVGGQPKWWGSVGFREVPDGWRIDARAHDFSVTGWSCGAVLESRIEGSKYFCLGAQHASPTPYYGGGYGMANAPRSEGEYEECVEPSRVGFRDGTEFNTTDIPEELRDQLSELAFADVDSAEVPEYSHQFKI